MNLTNHVIDHLNQPENKIAIVGIDKIRGDFSNLNSFREEMNSRMKNNFDLRFMEPGQIDDFGWDFIVIVSDKGKNMRENPDGLRIYIVNNFKQIKDYLRYYKVNF